MAACDPIPISYGDVINGALTTSSCSDGSEPPYYYDQYTIETVPGDIVRVSCTPSFLLDLFLYDPAIDFWYEGGDGTTSSQTLEFTATVAGTAKIEVWTWGASITGAYTLVITNGNIFNANFITTVGSTFEEIHFIDTSTVPSGTITNWSWNFGDGATSTVQNPVHTYASLGTYSVTLTVTNSENEQSSITQDIYVLEQLIANFTVIQDGGQTKIDATNSLTPTGTTIVAYQWLSSNNNSYSYIPIFEAVNFQNGDTLSLTVYNSLGKTASTGKTLVIPDNYITIVTRNNISLDVDSKELYLSYSNSLASIIGSATVSATWNFGDGNTETVNEYNGRVYHTYATFGFFEISCSITVSGTTYTTSKKIYSKGFYIDPTEIPPFYYDIPYYYELKIWNFYEGYVQGNGFAVWDHQPTPYLATARLPHGITWRGRYGFDYDYHIANPDNGNSLTTGTFILDGTPIIPVDDSDNRCGNVLDIKCSINYGGY